MVIPNAKGYHWEAIIYLLVIAAGFGSPLAKGLGLGKVGDFVIGAQTEVATTTLDEIEVYFGEEMAPGFLSGWYQHRRRRLCWGCYHVAARDCT